MRREARIAAARAACAVHELWTDGDNDKKVREGWPKEWMQEVEKATDAIDKIRRGRKARGEEYEGIGGVGGRECVPQDQVYTWHKTVTQKGHRC